jgi:hypothetical protein
MKFLRDISGLSRAQRVGASLHLFGSGICTSTPAVGASGTRLREMCVLRYGVRVARSEEL